jgi:hypothetical protein
MVIWLVAFLPLIILRVIYFLPDLKNLLKSFGY